MVEAQVNQNEVIADLGNQIANLTVENAALRSALRMATDRIAELEGDTGKDEEG